MKSKELGGKEVDLTYHTIGVGSNETTITDLLIVSLLNTSLPMMTIQSTLPTGFLILIVC